MSGKYALIIGNTEYIDPGLAQLTAPGRDAEDFARVLKDHEIGAFDSVRILLNQMSSTVNESIDEFFDQKKPDDLLVLYFSGHGVRDEIGSLYLAVRNTIRSRLRSTAIKSDYIREVMDQSRSRRQVLILDCCNSGAFAQGTKTATGVSIGTASAFEGGYGRIILTASDSTQFAWEGDKVIGETDNSLFTHYLVEGLEGEADLDGDGRITVDELYDYAYEKVRFATPKQTPSKFSSKQQGEIILRQNMRIEDIKPVSLPNELIEATEDSRTFVREGAVQQLEKLLKGKNLGLARSARETLERVEKEDDSRRVSQAATQVLEQIRQAKQRADEEQMAREEAEHLAILKAEEERLAAEKVEAERKAKQEAERLLAEQQEEEERESQEEANRLVTVKVKEERLAREKAEAERRAKEKAEHLAKQKAEEERTAKAKIESERIAKEKAQVERKAKEKTARERQDRNSAQIKDKFNQLGVYGKAKWKALVNYVQSLPKNRTKIYIFLNVAIAFIVVVVFLLNQQFNNSTLFFSSNKAGGTDVYSYSKNTTTKMTLSTGGTKNWLPAVSAFGDLYFTSNRTGNAEIYRIKDDGNVQQITDTPGTAASWAPAVSAFGDLYFTSNRTGNTEIYRIKNDGNVQQITDTPGTAASWAPAVSAFGDLYFTSNRTGNAEIYRIKNDGNVQQITDTPGTAASWAPAVSAFGDLYFTSNRTGKAEIYRIKNDGNVQQITNTPGTAASWAPIIGGQNVYFTSNRDGRNSVYLLNDTLSIKISSADSWTSTLNAKDPFSSNP